MTLRERLADARARLVGAGINPSEAALDVDLYARTILGWDRARLLLHHHEAAPEALEPRFSDWVGRRVHFEPTAYIVGSREFWGLDFHVSPAVLVPRPETELIVEEVLAIAQREPASRRIEAADIGTGSGCIAVSVAHGLRQCRFVATDVSLDAVMVARQNAVAHGVQDRVTTVCCSYLDGVGGTFDLITANPPYVRDVDKRGLSADVLREPHVALFGGATGLDHVGAVLDTAAARLRPGGWLVMEFGFGQEDDVRALVARRPLLRFDGTRADLQGLARTAIIQRR